MPVININNDDIRLNSSSSDKVVVNGNLMLGTTSAYTTGGTAKITLNGIFSIGSSNTDMSYIRRAGSGVFQWQTFFAGNTGEIHLQPYGGNVGIGTTAPDDKLHVSTGTDTDAGLIGIIIGGTEENSRQAKIEKQTSGTRSLSIYSSLSNSSLEPISFLTGVGAERLTILEGGNVGIGTTNPSYKLDVAGEIRLNSGNAFTDLDIKSDRTSGNIGGINFVNGSDDIKGQVYGNNDGSVRIATNGTTLAVLVDSSQNVGIGTTSPNFKLHVSTGDASLVTQPTAGTYGVYIQQDTNGTTGGLCIIDGSNNTGYSLYVGDNLGSPRLMVSSDGNVGVGTESPNAKLDIGGAAAPSIRITSSSGPYSVISSNTVGSLEFSADDDNTGAASNINFKLDGSDVVRINSTGVGIGTTNPNALLEISGNAGADPGPITNPITFRITDAGNAATGAGDTDNPWGRIQFYSEDQSSGGPSVQAQIASIYGNIYSSSSHLAFYTQALPTTGIVERMRILDTGGVSIGTSSATGLFNVQGISYFADDIILRDGSVSSGDTLVRIYDSSDDGVIDVYRNNSVVNRIHGNGNSYFNAGNVGIGTTAPGSRLTVAGAGGSTLGTDGYLVHIGGTDSSIDPVRYMIGFSHGATYTAGNVRAAIGSLITLGGNGNLVFETGAGGAGQTERMRINGDGNVGIGTPAPSEKLHIDGRLRVVTIDNGTGDFATISGTGVITRRTASEVLSDIGAQAAGSYLTAEADTLATVTGRGATTTENVGVGSLDIASGGLITWVRTYAVSNTVVLPLLNTSGNNILTGGAYRVTAHIDVTGTDQSSKAVFWNQNGTWYLNETSRSGFSSNHIQFLIDSGVPSVKTFHPNLYSVRVLHEWINLYEGTGTDNTKDFWGTDAYMSNIVGNVTFNNGGNVIVPSGNVGIGTTAPTTAKLVVDTSSSVAASFGRDGTDGDVVQVYNGASGTTKVIALGASGNDGTIYSQFGNLILQQSAGNVGIGTDDPDQHLHVLGGTIKIESDGSAAAGAVLELKHANNNTTDVCATINMTNGVGGYAAIEGGTTGANNTGYIAFKTDNAGAQGEAMRIIGNGNVGIGTTAPTSGYRLDVVGSILSRVASGNTSVVVQTNNANGAINATAGSGLEIATDGTNQNIAFRTGVSTRMRITSAGNVGINTTAPQQLLHVLGATNGYAMIQGANDAGQAGIYFKKEDTTGTMDRTKGLIVFHTNVGSGFGRGHLGFCLNSADSNTVVSVSDEKFRMVDNGDFLADGDVVAYSTTISDARYKTNIQPIESALDKVNQMRGVSFDWTAVRTGREFGVIAQEIEQIAPEVVSEKELLNGDTMKTVSYTSLVPFLIESIKELTQQVNELKAQLDGLTK